MVWEEDGPFLRFKTYFTNSRQAQVSRADEPVSLRPRASAAEMMAGESASEKPLTRRRPPRLSERT